MTASPRQSSCFSASAAIGPGVLAIILTASQQSAFAEKSNPKADTAAKTEFFETKIRPLLSARCFKCHGKEKQNGGLRVDALSTLLKGGESGVALVAGKPEESLLVKAIRWESFEMPPSGKLPAAEISLLTRWIAGGAFWPEHDAVLREDEPATPKITDDDRACGGRFNRSQTHPFLTPRLQVGRATKLTLSSSESCGQPDFRRHQKPTVAR